MKIMFFDPKIGGNVTLILNFTPGMTCCKGRFDPPCGNRVTQPKTWKPGNPIPYFEVAESEYHGRFMQFCGGFFLRKSLFYVEKRTR